MPSMLISPLALLRRLWDTFWFYHLGVPDAAEYFIKRFGDVAPVDIMQAGKIIFVSK